VSQIVRARDLDSAHWMTFMASSPRRTQWISAPPGQPILAAQQELADTLAHSRDSRSPVSHSISHFLQ
jgi:hypothetical protein